MSVVYTAGEVNSVLQGQYRQDATITTKIMIDSTEYRIRVPVACRSFVHPVGGMRVTRTVGKLFEFQLNDGNKAYLGVEYDCREKDASISYGENYLLRVYRISKEPTLRVVADWALPASNEFSPSAPIVATENKLDRATGDTNGKPVSSIRQALEERGLLSDKGVLLSVHAESISLISKMIESGDVEQLKKASTPNQVPIPIGKKIVDNHHRYRNGLPEGHALNLPQLTNEVPFNLSNESRTFELGKPNFGRRVYYLLPSTDECSTANTRSTTIATMIARDCSRKNIKFQVGSYVAANNGFRMIYEPQSQTIYWLQDREL